MNTAWSILYRGPLSSCNYECGYCPFAKTHNTADELHHDADRLQRFVAWVAGRAEQISILFTPWGEALVHRYYQEALVRLSHLKNIGCVSIQTNLSCRLDWVARANPRALALWTTFHPSQTGIERFAGQCRVLDAHGIAYSVGVVGVKEAIPFIEPLRRALSPKIYVWINAYKRVPDYYDQTELSFLASVDPGFTVNNQRHASLGRACRTGHTVFTVDGEGDIRRCHFVPKILGNIYQPGFEPALQPRACTAETCGCHIGYVHLPHLKLDMEYGEGLLPRIPRAFSRLAIPVASA